MELSPFETAIQELHAATYAVILHTESEALRDGCDSYWTRVLDQYHGDATMTKKLMDSLNDMEQRAQLHAAAMAESISALMIRRACTDAHLDKNDSHDTE